MITQIEVCVICTDDIALPIHYWCFVKARFSYFQLYKYYSTGMRAKFKDIWRLIKI